MHRNLSAGLGPALAALLLLGSCASAPSAPEPPRLVSSSATAALVIADPAGFLQGLSQAWASSRLGEVTGLDPKTSFESQFPFAAIAERLIDGRRPWVLELLPSADSEAGPSFLVELPYVGDPAELSRALVRLGLVEKGRDSGYIAFAEGEAAVDFPAAESADLSLLERWPKASLALWINSAKLGEAGNLFDQAQRLLGGGASSLEEPPRPFQRAFREGVAKRSGTSLAAEERLADEELKTLASTFKPKLRDLSLALVPSRSALGLRAALRLAPGSPGAGLLAEAARAPSALPWTVMLPADALLSASWATDPLFAKHLDASLRPFLASLLKTSGLKDAADSQALLDAALASSSIDEELAALGDRGALWLDLDPAALVSAARALDGGDSARLADLVPRLLSVRESRDPEAAAALMRKTFDPDALGPLTQSLASSGGFRLDFTARSSGQGLGASGILAFAASNPEWSEDQVAAVEALATAATLRWKVGPRLLALGLGGDDEIAAAASGTPPASPLSRSPAFVAQARLIPQGSQYLFSLSTARLAALVRAGLGAEKGGSPSFDPERIRPERFGLLSFWLLAEPAPDGAGAASSAATAGASAAPGDPSAVEAGPPGPLAEFGLALGASDIGALVELFLPHEGAEAAE